MRNVADNAALRDMNNYYTHDGGAFVFVGAGGNFYALCFPGETASAKIPIIPNRYGASPDQNGYYEYWGWDCSFAPKLATATFTSALTQDVGQISVDTLPGAEVVVQ